MQQLPLLRSPNVRSSVAHFRPEHAGSVRLIVLATASFLFAGIAASFAADSTNSTAQDHKNTMEQLGIKRLRPGPSGRVGATNAANYDPAKANPFPDLPDPLTLKNGKKVTTAEMWWKQRRPEIVEDFEREVIGRVPKNVPRVTWTITTQAVDRAVGEIPVVAKQMEGQV